MPKVGEIKEIRVEEYDENWPIQFQQESNKISKIINKGIVSIHHFGSTSIPGLAAKNEIDVLLVIKNIKDSLVLQNFGYFFKGELNIPLRYFFSNNTAKHKINVHACQPCHSFIDLNLAFKKHLISNPKDKTAYQKLKISIAESPDSCFKTRGWSNYGLKKK